MGFNFQYMAKGSIPLNRKYVGPARIYETEIGKFFRCGLRYLKYQTLNLKHLRMMVIDGMAGIVIRFNGD